MITFWCSAGTRTVGIQNSRIPSCSVGHAMPFDGRLLS